MGGKTVGGLAFGYLVLYNVAQTIGWSLMGYNMVQYFVENQTNVGLYNHISQMLMVFQSAAILEIFHAYTKIVPSNTAMTAMQVFSRVTLVWCVMGQIVGVRNSIGVSLLLAAWTLTEIIRYSYYVFGLFDNIPYILMWLRYSLFVFLYPLGVTGELWTIYDSLGPVAADKILSIAMPNKYNFVFNFYYVLCGLFFVYAFYFPKLYFHMFAQRKKNLGASSAKKVE